MLKVVRLSDETVKVSGKNGCRGVLSLDSLDRDLQQRIAMAPNKCHPDISSAMIGEVYLSGKEISVIRQAVL